MSWQLVATIACVAAAALFIGRRIWRFLRASSHGDASCSGCARSQQPMRLKQIPFVPMPGMDRKTGASESREPGA